jgi:hypothetical protein
MVVISESVSVYSGRSTAANAIREVQQVIYAIEHTFTSYNSERVVIVKAQLRSFRKTLGKMPVLKTIYYRRRRK